VVATHPAPGSLGVPDPGFLNNEELMGKYKTINSRMWLLLDRDALILLSTGYTLTTLFPNWLHSGKESVMDRINWMVSVISFRQIRDINGKDRTPPDQDNAHWVSISLLMLRILPARHVALLLYKFISICDSTLRRFPCKQNARR